VSTTLERAGWTSLHCFLHWSARDFDEFLTGSVRPVLDGARADGALADWFYIRYWEGGPHLRLRARDVRDPHRMRCLLARRVAASARPVLDLTRESFPPTARRQSAWFSHGAVEEIEYRPETRRYGGPDALPVMERVFCRSTEIALDALAAAPQSRLTAALGLVYATALGLGLDDLATARWLRGAAGAWRWSTDVPMLPAATVLGNATRTLSANADGLRDRLAALRSGWDRHGGVEGRWARVVADAHGELAGSDTPADGRWLIPWASQAHMLCNRLGVQPDEERALCWLISGALLGHTEPDAFLADSATSADRVFLERSKLLPGLRGQVPPATSPPDATSQWPAQAVVDLPGGPPPDVPIGAAIELRQSARRFVGPVRAAEIGTLVRTAFAARRARTIRRPEGSVTFPLRGYPSAGGMYLTQLRLLVADVDGIEPGDYRVDPIQAQLHRLGEHPALDELAATSTWFVADPATSDAVDAGAIDISRTPAMLVLSVDLDRARAKYGVRALRFALLEAGHLAQNLVLVAAAARLASITIGGFYDDVVHELLGIDGVGESVQYLIPLGSARDPGGLSGTTTTES